MNKTRRYNAIIYTLWTIIYNNFDYQLCDQNKTGNKKKRERKRKKQNEMKL